MKIIAFFRLIIAIIICELAGGIGALFTAPALPTWYASLQKPSFNPPSWIFGPVWTILFALMGIALYLVWSSDVPETQRVRTRAFVLFFIQFILNIGWSFVFFRLRSPDGAFVEIVMLWFAILATIASFAKVSRAAAWLLVPYILWVSFAGVLTYAIAKQNYRTIDEVIFCTQEAKQCPDGSYVGRTGPHCEFAPCP